MPVEPVFLISTPHHLTLPWEGRGWVRRILGAVVKKESHNDGLLPLSEKLGGQEPSKSPSISGEARSQGLGCISHMGCAPCLNRELHPALSVVETFRMVKPKSTVKKEEPKSREQRPRQ